MWTAKQLRKFLKTVPDDAIIIMSYDDDGNGYSPLSRVCDNKVWDMKHYEVGYKKLTDELRAAGYTESDLVDGAPAVVFWP